MSHPCLFFIAVMSVSCLRTGFELVEKADDDASSSSDARRLAASSAHTCAIIDGVVRCWGSNFEDRFAETGPGTSTPMTPSGFPDGATSVAAGNRTCVVADGELRCIGGDTGLVQVFSTGATAVAAFDNQLCAIVDSALTCWDGQATPAVIAGFEDGVTMLELGWESRACVVRNEALWCGGLEGLEAIDLPPPITAAAVGTYEMCAIADAELYCWSSYRNGPSVDLGDPQPVSLSDDATPSSVAAGWSHTCAVAAGGVQCWGANYEGMCGDDELLLERLPGWVAGLGAGAGAIDIVAGSFHTCTLLDDDEVFCWGHGGYGQLGDAVPLTLGQLSPVVGLDSGVVALAGGSDCCNQGIGMCAVRNGAVLCWGEGTVGPSSSATPELITGLPASVTDIGRGRSEVCAVAAGQVWCWNQAASPALVGGVLDATAVALAGEVACAVAGGEVWCWGQNMHGQLGRGFVSGGEYVAAAVVGLQDVTAVAVGLEHACAVVGEADVWCWGQNGDGQIGNDTLGGDVLAPAQVLGLPAGVVSDVAAGTDASCALVDGGVHCWGEGLRLGYASGLDVPQAIATPIAGPPAGGVTAISGATGAYCAAATDGIWCWGTSDEGRLGQGLAVAALAVPMRLSAGVPAGPATVVGVGKTVSCGVIAGILYCWGASYYGERGDGVLPRAEAPVEVTGL